MSKLKLAFKTLKGSNGFGIKMSLEDAISSIDEAIDEYEETIKELDEIINGIPYYWRDIINDNGGVYRFLRNWDMDEYVEDGGSEEEAEVIDELADYVRSNEDLIEFIIDNPHFVDDMNKIKKEIGRYI